MTEMTEESMLEKAERQAKLCEVFSNPKRVLILWHLMEQEMSVGEIAQAIHTSLQNASQHLRHMKVNNIVTTRRDGQTVYYRISTHMPKRECVWREKIH